jgi:hypothetical protein
VVDSSGSRHAGRMEEDVWISLLGIIVELYDVRGCCFCKVVGVGSDQLLFGRPTVYQSRGCPGTSTVDLYTSTSFTDPVP